MKGIILYGPPASGKSTITNALNKLDNRFQIYQRLKAGTGRRNEYRMTSHEELNSLRGSGEIIWENIRYGSIYAIDRTELLRMFSAKAIPVVHTGQEAAVEALKAIGHSWLIVSLECPRAVAVERIHSRATGDDLARIDAWDRTKPLTAQDLTIATHLCTPTEAARIIKNAYEGTSPL